MSSSSWVAKALGVTGGSDQEDSGGDDLVVLVQGKNVFNDSIYCYLRIPHPKLEEFRGKLENNQKFDIREYGDVIAAGRGLPNQEVQDEMTRDFGMMPVDFNKPG